MLDEEDQALLTSILTAVDRLVTKHAKDISLPALTALTTGRGEIELGAHYLERG